MISSSDFTAVYLCLGIKILDDDDVGINVLRCRADIIIRDNINTCVLFIFYTINISGRIIIDNVCIALFSGVHKLTALYNISNIF